ncbi:MAG: hypothetical protein JXA77_13055 [Bacteroidales bacterium]|nr:hypothetical protein [Bacteroidales bacterium]
MDDQIGVWEARIDGTKAEAKAEYKEKMSDLKSKRNEVKAKYDGLADATEDKWAEAKDVFSSV